MAAFGRHGRQPLQIARLEITQALDLRLLFFFAAIGQLALENLHPKPVSGHWIHRMAAQSMNVCQACSHR